MKRLLVLAFLALASQARAASIQCGPPGTVLVPFAKEVVVVSTASIGLTAATYAPAGGMLPAWYAFITSDSAADDARFWPNGQAPTSTVGHEFVGGSVLEICQQGLPLLKFIRSGAADVSLYVTYYRPPQ